MNAAVANHIPLRKLTAARSGRAKREYYNCTDQANAQRVLGAMAKHAPGTLTWTHVRRMVESLPAVVRAEAQTAFAVAADIELRDRASELDYAEAIQRGRVLEYWATRCELPSTQAEAMELIRRAVKGPQP